MNKAEMVFKKMAGSTITVKKKRLEMNAEILSSGAKKVSRDVWVKKDKEILESNLARVNKYYDRKISGAKTVMGTLGGVAGAGIAGFTGMGLAEKFKRGKAGLIGGMAAVAGGVVGAVLGTKMVKKNPEKIKRISYNYRLSRAAVRDKTKGNKYNYYIR